MTTTIREKLIPILEPARAYLRETWLLSIGRGLALVGGLLSFIAIGNLLSPEIAGNYYYISAWAAILSFSTLPGISHGVVKLIKQEIDPDVVEQASVNIRLKYGIIGTIGMFIVGGVFVIMRNPLLGFLFILAGIVLPFGDTITECIFAKFRGTHDFTGQNKSVGTYQTLLAISIFISLIIFRKYQNIALLLLLSLPAIWGIFFYLIFISNKPKLSISKKNLNQLKSYAKSLSIYQTILGIGFYADKLILWVVATPVALATYSIAFLPILKLDQLMPFENLTIIKLANKEIGYAIYNKIIKAFLLCFVSFTIFTFLISLIAPFFLRILFPKYNLIYLFQIVMWSIPFIPLGIFRGALMSQTNHFHLRILSVGSVILRISFLLILGILFKEIGVAVGIVMSNGAETLMGIFLVRRIAYVNSRNLK